MWLASGSGKSNNVDFLNHIATFLSVHQAAGSPVQNQSAFKIVKAPGFERETSWLIKN
jgi:hypothetical protein